MNSDRAFEARLRSVFSESMGTRERAMLDARMAALLERAPKARRAFRPRLTRSLILVAALFILIPSIFGVTALLLSTEAPYGMESAAQYQAEVNAAKAVTPLPPGGTWPAWLDRPSDPHASYGVGGGRSVVEFNASCLWFEYWLSQRSQGTAATQAALAGLEQMRTWTSFTDPLMSDAGLRQHFQDMITAAERDDSKPIQEWVAVNCGP